MKGSRLISLKERGNIVLLRLKRREVEPRQRIFEVAPNALHRVQLRTIRRQEHQAHVGWEGQGLGGMRPTVVQEQQIQALREGLRKGLDEELEALGVQIRQLQEKALARGRLDRAIDIEPLEDMLDRADGLDTTRGEAPAPDGQ